MKKLSVVTIITILCVFSIHHTYTAEEASGLQIQNLDVLIDEAAKKTVADAAEKLKNNIIPVLKDEVIPALGDTLKDKVVPALKNVIDEKMPVFKEAARDALVEAVPHILLSTAGLIVTSAGIMLVYQGLKADSTDDENNNSSKKVNTVKLLGYGSALIIIGVATIMHTSIRNYFSNPKS
ncbi:MAG: hypothetical protein ACHQVS_03200 [Candidatus Babeliales bacterium]